MHEWVVRYHVSDKNIGYTLIKGVCISTVFLGVDMSFGSSGAAPEIFEAKVVGGPHHMDGRMLRTSTWID